MRSLHNHQHDDIANLTRAAHSLSFWAKVSPGCCSFRPLDGDQLIEGVGPIACTGWSAIERTGHHETSVTRLDSGELSSAQPSHAQGRQL